MFDSHLQHVRDKFRNAVHSILVESNLGLEAEHHAHRAQATLPRTRFEFISDAVTRPGVLTTAASKEGMYIATLRLLQDEALSLCPVDALITGDPDSNRQELADDLHQQLCTYSILDHRKMVAPGLPSKSMAQTLTGKMGGAQDDLAIVLQLNVLYHSKRGV